MEELVALTSALFLIVFIGVVILIVAKLAAEFMIAIDRWFDEW